MKSHRQSIARAAAFVLAAAAPLAPAQSPTQAQDYPHRVIRLINPYSPGGSTEIVVRTMAQKLTEALHQPVVVENRPGAGSNLGNEAVAKSAPDGYTLLNGTSSLAVNPSVYPKLGYDPVKDLAPIVTMTTSPNVLGVHPSVPAKSVAELVALAKAKPGSLSYGSSGNGATNHLAAELFKSMAGVDMVHVPYKGGGPALTDLLAGQIQVLFNPPSSLMPHHRTGRARVLAVTTRSRLEGLDLPTVAETLPGFESTVWFALFAPAGTPAPIIARLNAEVNRALKDPAVAEQFRAVGLFPVGGTPEDLAQLLRTDLERWAKVVRTAKVKVD